MERSAAITPARVPRVQTACARCSVGVMDNDNPHVWGECECSCHGRCDVCDGPLDDAYRTDEDGSFRACSRCGENRVPS